MLGGGLQGWLRSACAFFFLLAAAAAPSTSCPPPSAAKTQRAARTASHAATENVGHCLVVRGVDVWLVCEREVKQKKEACIIIQRRRRRRKGRRQEEEAKQQGNNNKPMPLFLTPYLYNSDIHNTHTLISLFLWCLLSVSHPNSLFSLHPPPTPPQPRGRPPHPPQATSKKSLGINGQDRQQGHAQAG